MKHSAIWDKFVVHIVHTDAPITVPRRLIAVHGVYMDVNRTEPDCYWNVKALHFLLRFFCRLFPALFKGNLCEFVMLFTIHKLQFLTLFTIHKLQFVMLLTIHNLQYVNSVKQGIC
jgi:hypothetical protein